MNEISDSIARTIFEMGNHDKDPDRDHLGMAAFHVYDEYAAQISADLMVKGYTIRRTEWGPKLSGLECTLRET